MSAGETTLAHQGEATREAKGPPPARAPSAPEEASPHLLERLQESGLLGRRRWRRREALGIAGALALLFIVAFAFGPFGALIGALVAAAVATALIVAILVRRNRALSRQQHRDGVTGLPNQLAFWKTAPRAVSESRHEPTSLVCLEIDNHRELIGLYGHLAVDRMLARLAELMDEVAPDGATCFRYGDAELLILVPGCNEEGAVAVAERLAAAAEEVSDEPAELSISAGVACTTAAKEAGELVLAARLFDEADRALRVAKRNGKGRVVASSSPAVGEFDLLDPEIEAARRAAIEMARAALGARHSETATHSDEVVELAQVIGQSVGLEPDDRQTLELAAGLHDIGKIATPRDILNKPGPLSDDEWAVVREHTVVGERIMRSVPELAPAATVVRHAHEHWDGSGYPDGLAGDQIPLASRVVLCADAFHAIRSDRPYRAARSSTAALDEIRANAGKQFDPEVVEALERVAAAARRRAGRFSRRTIALLTTLAVLLAGTAVAKLTGVFDLPVIGSAGGADRPTSAPLYPVGAGDSARGERAEKDRGGDGSDGSSARRSDDRDGGGGDRSSSGTSGGGGESEGNAYALGQGPGNPGRGTAWGQGSGGGQGHPKK